MTVGHKYSLDNRPGKKKYQCPGCGAAKKFTRYIDLDLFEEVSNEVGKCDRLDNCGYHYTPGQFFKDNPGNVVQEKRPVAPVERILPAVSYIEFSYLKQSMQARFYEQNSYFQYLSKCFDAHFAMNLCNRYLIGTSNRWPGAAVFWLVDINLRVRSGKIVPINATTGKRLHAPAVDSSLDWVHAKLIREKALDKFNLSQCFFGEHLLKHEIDMPVAIVEGEKTAIICSVYMPEYLWLAAGNIHGLNSLDKCKVLKGREVVLFPDLGAGYKVWEQKAKVLRQELSLNIRVSNILERRILSEAEKSKGYDLEDYLFKTDAEGKAIKNGKRLVDLIPVWEYYNVQFK